MRRLFTVAIVIVVVATAHVSIAQPLFDLPRVSPAASVTQRVGITDITIDYHRPGAKERAIWGDLVPYDTVWRAGANENTTITFSTPVYINEVELDAGSYGLHILPTETEWTFILSYQSHAWGSFSYDENEDAVRATAIPSPHEFTERLLYTFNDLTETSAVVTLAWEELKTSFKIDVDTDAIVTASLNNELRGLPRFFWRGWQQAAAWCIQNDTNLDQADEWIDRSISIDANFTNMRWKAALLEKRGDAAAAETMMNDAMVLATEAELNVYGYQLMGEGKIDDAIAIFTRNVDNHPDSWNAYDSLAEAYMNKGDNTAAVENYTKALNMVEDATQKQRIEGQLAKLR